MSTTISQFEFIFDQLSFVSQLRSRKMFGEYEIYSGDKFFALVCNDSLFLKVTPALRSILIDDGIRPYGGATDGYFHIPDIELEDLDILKKYVTASLDFIPKPKKVKKIV
jgi:TfoX/Sxy family transcriptional regulator of competence genes